MNLNILFILLKYNIKLANFIMKLFIFRELLYFNFLFNIYFTLTFIFIYINMIKIKL